MGAYRKANFSRTYYIYTHDNMQFNENIPL